MGKKRKVEKGKTWAKNGLVHLTFFAFILLFLICFFLNFYFAFVLPFSRQKAKYMQKKNKLRKQLQKTSNGQVILFFPFWLFSMFFPFYFAFVFFWILLIWFLFFPFLFLHLSWVFSSLLILRISYGLVNIRLAISVQLLVLGMIKALTSTDATEERKRERGSGYAQREREREREMEWYWHLSHLIWSLTYCNLGIASLLHSTHCQPAWGSDMAASCRGNRAEMWLGVGGKYFSSPQSCPMYKPWLGKTDEIWWSAFLKGISHDYAPSLFCVVFPQQLGSFDPFRRFTALEW